MSIDGIFKEFAYSQLYTPRFLQSLKYIENACQMESGLSTDLNSSSFAIVTYATDWNLYVEGLQYIDDFTCNQFLLLNSITNKLL